MKKQILLLLLILMTNVCIGQAKNDVKYVRLNANSPEAQPDLEAMKIAFEKMRAIGCENGLAWYYQGAIHNVPDSIKGKNILCSEYQTNKDKLFAWGDCTHTDSQGASLNFLLWHRMYTWHFEKIVRELSGKKDFALPYWNYGSDNINDNIMSEKLREKSSSLYEEARYDALNNGKPIEEEDIKTIQKAINEFKTDKLFTTSTGFSKMLETSPHNLMHGYIGTGSHYNKILQKKDSPGLMGIVESAGFDPVFWLHHSMIDRIWKSWDVNILGDRPTLKQLEANPWDYNFIEPNGVHITYTMKEVYDIVFNLDYKYDTLLYESEAPVLASNNAPLLKSSIFQVQDDMHKVKVIWKKKIGKVLGSKEFVHKVIKKPARKTLNSLKKLNNLNSSVDNYRLILNLDIVLYKEPRDYYTVYLRYPDKEDEYVGVMTFFGVAHDHGTGKNHTIGENGVKLNFSYFISDDLMESNKNFDVIIKKNGKGEAKVTLEKISLTRQN